jgi:hypothetical protein
MRASGRSEPERGSALVMALLMLSVVGVVMAAALDYAGTSLRASNVAVRPQRASSYAADGALQTAIEFLRDNPQAGADFYNACAPITSTYPDPTVGNVTIDTCPQPDSLIHQGNFRAVLLTLGTSTSEGVRLTHNGAVNLGGDVWSNSVIQLNSTTSMRVNAGNVWAWNACTPVGNIVVDSGYTTTCNASSTFGGVKPKVALDPGDASLGHAADWKPLALPATLVQPAIPACVAGTATLAPGVYYDPAALSALTTTCSNVRLNPGPYFLDFPDENTLWNVSGTVTATCDASGQGAQLVFARKSRMNVTGTLDIPCGRRATATGPRIALYGLDADMGASGPFNTTLRPLAVAQGGDNLFTPSSLANALPSAAPGYPRDGTNAVATVSGSLLSRTAQLTLSSMTPSSGPALTGNAQLSSVVVKVGHDETSRTTIPSGQSQLVWGSCAVSLNPTPTRSGSPTTYVSSNLASSLSSCASFDPTKPISVVWTVRTNALSFSTQTIHVDGAQVEVNWNNPGVLAQSGCVIQVGGCSLVTAGTATTVTTPDVIYIPENLLASGSGRFNLTSGRKLGTALVARSINADINVTPTTGPAIGFDPNARANGNVLVKAKIAGTTWVRARLHYPSTGGAPTIDSWTVDR